MTRDPLDRHRNYNRRTCTLCQLNKEPGRASRICGWCENYIAWRKTEMPDPREFLSLSKAEKADRDLRILRYQSRAAAELPLFDEDERESAA